MKRNGFKILTAAALLTLGTATMSAYAAEGWAMSNNTWVYLDRDGERVTDEWRKGADNLWRYLNYEGEMAINTWAEDEYYVDSNGIMLTNQWIKTTPQYDEDSDEVWFYFGSSGKMSKDGKKKIDGRYYFFDEDGIMQTGWSEDGMFYLGGDGAARTGWRYMEEPSEEDDVDWDYEYAGPESEDGKYWFYFGTNGRKYCAADTDDGDSTYRVAKISGQTYCFDEYGRMMTGWVYMNGDPDNGDDSIEGWRYFAENGIQNVVLGTAIKGWLSLLPPDPIQNEIGDEVLWYYFDSNGIPEASKESGHVSTDDFIRINGKSYLFNKYGNPMSGLVKVEIGDTGEYTSYYFDSDTKLPLKGKKQIEEGDGSKSMFYFSESSLAGRGYTGVKNNYLYYMGKCQEAYEGMKYAAITIIEDGKKRTYVVNESGRVAKNRTVKDDNSTKFTTNSSGLLTHVDGVAVGSQTFDLPMEPFFEDWQY